MFPPFLKTKGFHELSNLCRSALPVKEQAQLVTNQHQNILKLWIRNKLQHILFALQTYILLKSPSFIKYLLKFSTFILTSCCEVSSRTKKTFANCSYSRWREKDFSTTSIKASFQSNMIGHHFSKLKPIGAFSDF
jgi:hypothetical protein